MIDLATDRRSLINKLQSNLSCIRKIAGWTTIDLGRKIGVTKQTISNLENHKTPMTFTQYIAIRKVIENEIEIKHQNVILPKIITLLLDSFESDQEEYIKIQGVSRTIAAMAVDGASYVKLEEVFYILIQSLPEVASYFDTKFASKTEWNKILLD